MTAPGDRAPLLLQAGPAARLHVEVVPVSGREPDPAALGLLLDRLRAVCAKPGGVTAAVLPSVTAAVNTGNAFRRWTHADLEAFERIHRATEEAPDRFVVAVLYVDGASAENPSAAGLAYNDHAVAVFRDQLGAAGKSESHVLVHELGHQLGLVNGHTPMLTPHGDASSPGHCANPACVMFREVDPATLGATDFDDACREDLARAAAP